MNLKEVLKKQGGWKLVKQYWKSGAFFTAIGELLLLGKSRTALEILRLAANLRTKQKLEKRYKNYLEEFDQQWTDKVHESSDKVWICWFQGIEKAPVLVQKCYQSIREHMPNKEIILLTSENFKNYVQFPDYIIEKWEKGYITHTHMTDLLRLELLIKYGGLWLDATVYCSGDNIPKYITDSELFFFQCLKPGRDGHSTYISSWLIGAKTNNKVLLATRALCYAYWKENNEMWDYFLLHNFVSIVLDRYPEEWKSIVPRDNAAPHILYLRLFEPYDEKIWSSIKEQTAFHKLSYKFKIEQADLTDTFYERIFKS